MKMSYYYWFNRQEILQKGKEKYSIKEKATEHYKNLSQQEKDKIKEYQKRGIKNWFSIKKKR